MARQETRNYSRLKFLQDLDLLARRYAEGWTIYAHPNTIERFRRENEQIASTFKPNEFIEEGTLVAIDPQLGGDFSTDDCSCCPEKSKVPFTVHPPTEI